MKKNIRVLVIDDEDRIRSLVRMYLEREDFKVDEASDGDEALTKVENHSYNVIILDLMLPVTDGMIVCREIRSFSDVPIIMLTAKGDEVDRIVGFEMGADDYVVKPFSPRELSARVKALLRRAEKRETNGPKKVLRLSDLTIDIDAHKTFVEGREITLTPKEYDLLHFLANNEGKVFSREKLLSKVWGYDYCGDVRTVDTHIKNIREKISAISEKNFIHTVWGVGYKFEVIN